MPRWLILGLVAALSLPSYAAKRLTVAQMEQTLSSTANAHKTDIELSREVGQIQLSERISANTLERLKRQVAKDPRTQLALQLLADMSSFLPLPTNELPAIPPPDPAMQQRQMEATRTYTFEMVPRLPDLLATRTTYSFDDSPQEEEKGEWLERAGLHLVGTSKTEVSVLRERENLSVKESASLPAQSGLVTWGEFGSALLMILNDSAHGTIAWSHWEQAASGPVSVFDFSVPKSASHYQIATPVEQTQGGGGSSRWWAAGGMGSGDTITSPKERLSKAAYHGSLWIDPASGTILRVSLIADLNGNPTLQSGAILVEYGPVRIKDQAFMCPVRSLALSMAPGSVTATLKGTPTEWLNENLFTNYHLFASTSRILTEQLSSSSPHAPVTAGDSALVSAGPPPPAQEPPTPAREESASHAPVVVQPPLSTLTEKANPNELSVPNEDVPAAPNEPPSGHVNQPAASGLASTPPPQPAATTRSDAGTTPTFHLNVNSVLVPVVVRDRHGNFIDDLQRENFEVFDDGRSKPLTGFLAEKRAPAPKTLEAPTSPGASEPQVVLPDRITVFLFDDLDMDFQEIAHTQAAATKALDGALTDSDMAAVVSTSGKVNSGLTRDRAKLVDAIEALRPVDIYHPDSADCPKISYYQADLIVNKHDENALQDVIKQIVWVCAPRTLVDIARGMAESAAKRSCTLGEQGVHATYTAITEYVRRMAKLPGQHIMILVSSGFLPIEQEARFEESKLMNLAADSNVTINSLDARGLYTTILGAGQDALGREPAQVEAYHQSAMRAGENAMGELAYATGGEFFHDNNDLEAGFRMLVEGPETVYVLAFSAGGVKADGAYHRLKVSVDRADVHVQARKGYFAPDGEHPRP